MSDESEDDFCYEVDPLDAELDSDLSDLDLDEFDPDIAAAVDSLNLDERTPQFSVVFGSMSNLPQEQKNVIRVFLSSTFTGKSFYLKEVSRL